MEKLTIKDIAEMAGVSTTVVSFVMNNKPGVNAITRKKVSDIIQRTNYRPNLSSRRLAFKKSFNISIVVRNDSSPFNNLFYFEIAQGLLEKSKEFGYNIVFTDILLKDEKVIMPEIIEQEDTDGIIFFQDTDMQILNEIDKRSIPYIIIDAHPDNNNKYACVKADYELAAYTATMHLIDAGHSEIALISSSSVPNFYIQIFKGYKSALDNNRLSIPSSLIQIDANDEKSAYNSMEKILTGSTLPTAVFCATDILAIGAIKCSKDKGFSVPSDISFVSIDDILLSRYIEPAITTIRIDKLAMGSFAMELIIKKINGEPVESITVDSDKLILRNSVRSI